MIMNNLNNYVYAYLDSDNQPYYIGKGIADRMSSLNHKCAVPTDPNKIIVVEANLTELGAYALERRLIRWYGRRDNGTGILENQTDGGPGTYGIIWYPEGLEAMREKKREWHKRHKTGRHKGAGNPMYGKTHSAETRAQMGRRGTEHSRYDATQYLFECIATGEQQAMTKLEFKQRTGSLSAGALITGHLKTSAGWRFVK